MKILLQKKGNGRTSKAIGEISINKTTITINQNTMSVYGLEKKMYFGIGKKENGVLVAIFTSDSKMMFMKLSQASKRSQSLSVSLNGENKASLSRYKGSYLMNMEVELLKGATCFILKPKL